MNPYYKDYSSFLAEVFPGLKVQKLSVNAGFSCPNRDGSLGRGGCIYCDNTSFTPSYCMETRGISAQIAEGKRFFGRKYPQMKYLAYFQSFTPTYGNSAAIEAMWREALDDDDVAGLVVGTRPDCLPDEILDILAAFDRCKPVIVELGAETFRDDTLRLINRGHDAGAIRSAARRLAERGLHTGLHLIAGLPGETDDDVIDNVRKACSLPISSIKMHQLQIIRGTELHRRMVSGEIKVIPYSLQRYLDLCVNIIETVPNHIAIERFLASSPPDKVVAPKWGLKNYRFVNMLHNHLDDIHNAKRKTKPEI